MNRRENIGQHGRTLGVARDAEFDAITQQDIFLEARDRLQISYDADTDNRNHAKAAMRFREGDQWDDAPATSQSMDQPELVINLSDAFITRVENNIRQQRPRGKCHPVGDGATVELAEIINGIGRHVETRSEAGVAYDQAAKHAITGGWGYFRLIAEYVAPDSFQKDLRILPIRNLFTVFDDPGAIMPTGCDRGWCLISVKMKLTEYRRKYGKEPAVDWNDMTRDQRTRDWQDKEEIRLAEYFRIREIEETLYGLRGSDGREFTRFKSELPSTEKLKEARITIDGNRQSARKRVEWFKLNGLSVMQRELLPGEYIPLFRVEGNAADIDGEVLKRGMMKGMMDPQRMVNYGEVAKIKRLGLAPKAPWIAAEGQVDGHDEWHSANTQAYSVLIYKPVTVATAQGDILLPPPVRQQPAQIEAGFAEFVQGMRTNLLAIAGQPHEPDADKEGQVISGRALKQRSKMSDQSHFQYYDNLTLAIAQCWRVMLDWIPHYFIEDGRIQRIIGEDSTPQMVTLNESVQEDPGVTKIKNDLSIGRYDVVMDTGPGYETKREEGAETLIELVNSAGLGPRIAQVGPDLVLRSIDHPYMQELADRFVAMTPEGLKQVMEGMPSRAKAIIQALGNENAQLKQALQAAQMEQKFGMQKEHMKAAVKAHDTLVNAETKRYDTEVRSETTLKAEEIKAGSKLLDSGAARGHEAKMAERELLHGAEEAERDRQHSSSESAADRAAQSAQVENEPKGASQ